MSPENAELYMYVDGVCNSSSNSNPCVVGKRNKCGTGKENTTRAEKKKD